MNNLLLSNYGIIVDHVYKNNTKFYFKYNNNIYILEEVYKNYNENILVYLNYNFYYKIIKNNQGALITKHFNKNYMLLQKSDSRYNLYDEIIDNLNKTIPNIEEKKYSWPELWSKKIDYYEKILETADDYKIIKESFNYYIGMSETAISYIKYNFMNRKEILVISHQRINKDDYFDPINVVIDYRARDIAEFLKSIFLSEDYKKIDLSNVFKKINFNRNEYILLYGRMLFPNFYFDAVDQIIDNKQKEENLYKIIHFSSEYEEFLNKIYTIINQKIKIPKINWITKY